MFRLPFFLFFLLLIPMRAPLAADFERDYRPLASLNLDDYVVLPR